MTDRCAKCGHPRAEHTYNGACYGLCGEFVPPRSEVQSGEPAAYRVMYCGKFMYFEPESKSVAEYYAQGDNNAEPLYLGVAQAERTWDVALSERIQQLEAGGAQRLSIPAILGLISFVRDGKGEALPSADLGSAAK